MREVAEEIKEEFSKVGVDVPVDEIEEKLRTLVDKYYVPLDEAKRSVANSLAKKYGVAKVVGVSETLERIADIDAPKKWVNLKGKVVQIWKSESDVISQVGLIGDESGFVRFVKWKSADLPDLEEEKCYLLKNVVTDYWQGQYSIKLNRNSEIIPLEEDIEVASQEVVKEGAIVSVQQGSGLIKRCPMCKRVIVKGICNEHGKVEGVYDLRIKAVIDDGKSPQDILFNKEITEELTGISIEQAKEWVREYLDPSVVQSEIAKKILGRYFVVKGSIVGQYLLVESFERLGGVKEEDVREALQKAEEMLS